MKEGIKMNENEKKTAVELVNDMVANGYHLMQYKSAEELVKEYDYFTLDDWKEMHDRFMSWKA